jgi:hypothetical protein
MGTRYLFGAQGYVTLVAKTRARPSSKGLGTIAGRGRVGFVADFLHDFFFVELL